jgi:hypothetical protein
MLRMENNQQMRGAAMRGILMVLGLIVAGIGAAVREFYWVSSALQGHLSSVLMVLLVLWAVYAVIELLIRAQRYEQILIQHDLLPPRTVRIS